MTLKKKQLLRTAKFELTDTTGRKANYCCLASPYFFLDCNPSLSGLQDKIVGHNP
jgi:hypothetical protein